MAGGGSNGLIYVGSAIQTAGTTDQVYIVAERSTAPTSGTRSHTLGVYEINCTSSDCSSYTMSSFNDLDLDLQDNQYSNHGVAKRILPSYNEIRVVGRRAPSVASGCDDDETDLVEKVWRPSSVQATHVVEENTTSCADRAFAWVEIDDGDTFATWTYSPPAGVQRSRFGDRTGASWGNIGTPFASPKNDHAQFTFNSSGQRAMVNHHEVTDPEIWLAMPDTSPLVTLEIEEEAFANYPAVAQTADGDYHIFHARVVSTDREIVEWSCDPSVSNCTTGGWSVGSDIDVVDRIRWLEFAEADNDRQYLLWEEDIDVTSGEEWRVWVAERCPGGSWVATMVLEPFDSDWHQNLLSGNPNIDVDNGNDRVHTTFQEGDTHDNTPLDSDLWWASKAVGSCP